MTNEEVIEQLKDISRSFSETYFGKWREALDLAIKALEQQPCEDTEVIKVSKGAVKARQGRFVIYDVEWLKKNFYSTEEKIYGQPKQPCEDAVSRKAVEKLSRDLVHVTRDKADFLCNFWEGLNTLPPVTPQASEEDIHREREQAYMLGYEDASKKFRTEPCEDCISRQKALDCFEQTNTRQGAKYAIETLPPVKPTNEDISEAYIKGYDYGVKDWFKSKTQPREDCISRKAVESVLYNLGLGDEENGEVEYKSALADCRDELQKLPSVTPQYTDEEIDRAQAVEQAYVDKMVELAVEGAKRPKGKWIYKWMKGQFCSECDEQSVWKFNYCPNCGAEMSGGGEDEVSD